MNNRNRKYYLCISNLSNDPSLIWYTTWSTTAESFYTPVAVTYWIIKIRIPEKLFNFLVRKKEGG